MAHPNYLTLIQGMRAEIGALAFSPDFPATKFLFFLAKKCQGSRH
jgi:hypothetical protein